VEEWRLVFLSGAAAPKPRREGSWRGAKHSKAGHISVAIVTAKGGGLHSMKAKVRKTVLNGRAKLVSTCL
jgi:hypothetical protein